MPKRMPKEHGNILPKFLTIRELCERFQISRWTIRRLEEHPIVPLIFTSIGTMKRIAESDAVAWWERWQEYTAAGGTIDGKPVEGFERVEPRR
jgi:hypothetical protein